MAHEVERIPFHLHWRESSAFKETYAGAMDTIVVEGQNLHAFPAARIFAGVRHDNKELHLVKGATPYYIGQPDKMAEAVRIVAGWLNKKKLLD